MRDTGLGIPAEQLARVFDDFHQVDSSMRRSREGAGLGLAISRRFVQAHAGRIWAQSEPSVGSTFTFALPIPEDDRSIPASFTPRSAQFPWSDVPSRVLVVDPDPGTAALVRRHMEGSEVLHWPGLEGLADQVALHHPRAVVINERSDARPEPTMPSAAKCSLAVPMIRCSLPSQEWMAHDLSVIACLVKPVETSQLLAEIRRLGNVRDILVVDDDRGFVQLLERVLKASMQNLTVRRAYDGEDGLAAMRTSKPDLALIDLAMPGMDGFGVLQAMRQNREVADVPVMVLTGASFPEDALTRDSSPIIIHRPGGLHTVETLKCLAAIIGALEPRYV